MNTLVLACCRYTSWLCAPITDEVASMVLASEVKSHLGKNFRNKGVGK
jgi:hypothetical protein